MHFNVYKNKTKWFACYNTGNTVHQDQVSCIQQTFPLLGPRDPALTRSRKGCLGAVVLNVEASSHSLCTVPWSSGNSLPKAIALRNELLHKAVSLSLSHPIAMTAAKADTKVPRTEGSEQNSEFRLG